MSAGMIDHWGMVQRIDADRATVVIETTGCRICGHGGHCGVGKHAAGKQSVRLELPLVEGIREGDFVHVVLPEFRLSVAAVLGYLFPVLASLAGAAVGLQAGDSGSAALGAGAGFLGSLVVARLAIALTGGLTPAPTIIPHAASPSPSFQE